MSPQRRWRSARPLRVVRRQPNPSHYPPLVPILRRTLQRDFTVEPDCVAVDEKQIQLKKAERMALCVIDVDSKVVPHARFSHHRGADPATTFLHELKEKHRVAEAVFLVDGIGYFTPLDKTDLTGNLNYSDRDIVERLFQTYTMRVGRFHET